MKKLIVLLIIGGFVPCAIANLMFNDNDNHIIDYVVSDYVTLIDNDNTQSSSENHTFVELVDSGQVSRIDTCGYGELVINGGIVNAGILARDNSHIVINAGIFPNVSDRHSYNNALIEVYGGQLTGQYFSSEGGDIKVYGYDFTVTEEPYFNTLETLYTFNGTLANGDVVSDLSVRGLPEDISFIEVPEPATLAMLALGGVLIRRRKVA